LILNCQRLNCISLIYFHLSDSNKLTVSNPNFNTDSDSDSDSDSVKQPKQSKQDSNSKNKGTNVRNASASNKRVRNSEDSGSQVKDFEYLIGKIHRDDENLQRYITERIYIHRNTGNIIGDRVLLLKDGRKHRIRDPHPIHVQSLVDMTTEYDQESSPSELRALVSNLLNVSRNEDVE